MYAHACKSLRGAGREFSLMVCPDTTGSASASSHASLSRVRSIYAWALTFKYSTHH